MTATLARERFDSLIDALSERGYQVLGPTEQAGAIQLAPVGSSADLPVGRTELQDGGSYRLRDRDDGALFGFSSGPQSWKRYLHPPTVRIWRARRGGDGIDFEAEPDDPAKMAFLGVRSCDLHAIRSLDSALLDIEHPDPVYRRRREGTFIVALNCSVAGGTCFCASMDTGPKARFGYDIAMTELISEGRHEFLLEAATDRGEEVLSALPAGAATDEDRAEAERVVEDTAANMGREIQREGLKELIYRNMEHPRWDEVSERCLTCGNCTMVCPTCFCTDVDDVTDLNGDGERWRRWDSCFTLGFTYVHGGNVRNSSRSRYRQWMSHKLATWEDQFGTDGCVGCGRCITWCPVAIDITEEAAVIRATDGEER